MASLRAELGSEWSEDSAADVNVAESLSWNGVESVDVNDGLLALDSGSRESSEAVVVEKS